MKRGLRRREFLRAAIGFGAGLIAGLPTGARIQEYVGNKQIIPGKMFDLVQRPVLPPLQTIVQGAGTDAEALDRIQALYALSAPLLALAWNETDDRRLRALYAMYLAHNAQPYGVVPVAADTLLGFARDQTAAYCGLYAKWQRVIARHLGVKCRRVELDDAAHGWTECLIADHWEVFDATVNVWLSVSMQEAQDGSPRHYRELYTPMLDAARPDAYEHWSASNGYYNALNLRWQVRDLGMTYRFPQHIVVIEE